MKSQRLFRNIIWRKILSTFNFRLFTQPPLHPRWESFFQQG